MQPQPNEDNDWFYSGMDSATPSSSQRHDVLLAPRHSTRVVLQPDRLGFPILH